MSGRDYYGAPYDQAGGARGTGTGYQHEGDDDGYDTTQPDMSNPFAHIQELIDEYGDQEYYNLMMEAAEYQDPASSSSQQVSWGSELDYGQAGGPSGTADQQQYDVFGNMIVPSAWNTSPDPGHGSGTLTAPQIPGRPRAVVARGTKGIYDRLEDTDGALHDSGDDVQECESPRLEELLQQATNHRINGWYFNVRTAVGSGGWRNYRLTTMTTGAEQRTVMRYAISRSGSVFVVKNVRLREEASPGLDWSSAAGAGAGAGWGGAGWGAHASSGQHMQQQQQQQLQLPYALSNLMGMAARGKVWGAPAFRHLVFYNVTNAGALAAMKAAYVRATGNALPELGGSSGWARDPTGRQAMARISDNQGAHAGAWAALHDNGQNPFTRAVGYLLSEEENFRWLAVRAYTVMFVPQERHFGDGGQVYWNALVAHFSQ